MKKSMKILLCVLFAYLATVLYHFLEPFTYETLFEHDVIDNFGPKGRIFVLKRDGRKELWDHRPEEAKKVTILDWDIHAKKSETDIFYRDTVFYSYGNAGFYVIYADPFHIKVWKNPDLGEKTEKRIEKSLKKYNSNQLYVIQNFDELTNTEQRAYLELRGHPKSIP